MSNNFVIVDYGMGNLFSIKKKLHSLNIVPIISSDKKEILRADKIILPGVGHFCKAMEQIKRFDLLDTLNQCVLKDKKPILGICLGMQLMAKKSEEGLCDGFGWVDAEVVRFKIENQIKFKVPHIGWNTISIEKTSSLLKDVPDESEFYFVHSYYVVAHNESDVLCKSNYEQEFCSALEKNNIFGVQFHPEKSHDAGEVLLNNFVKI